MAKATVANRDEDGKSDSGSNNINSHTAAAKEDSQQHQINSNSSCREHRTKISVVASST